MGAAGDSPRTETPGGSWLAAYVADGTTCAYVYGLQWVVGNAGLLLANILSVFVVVPLIHPLKITSAYEYLELRFESRLVRTIATSIGILGTIVYMGIVLFGPAIALEAVTGLPQWTSIVLVAVASVIYTAIGGLKAVIWTDVFQAFVMFAGFFAVLIKGTVQIGGIGKTWEIAYDKGRVNLFNFDPDPTVRHTFWNLFLGNLIRGFGLVFNQSSIQRISSTPTIRAAKRVFLFLAPGFFISLSLAAIEGVIAYSYYEVKGCDPLASGQITNPNQIIPYMVMDIFYGIPGMPGLFLASLFSATLSTLSSGLSSSSALIWTDLVKPFTKPMTEFRATVISKIAVVVVGGVSIFVAFMIAMIGGTLIQIAGTMAAAFGGPLTGMFLLGAFCPWANSKGAIGGTAISVVTTFALTLGQMMTKGAVRNTKLPSGSTDMCPALNLTSVVLGPAVNLTSVVMNLTAYSTTSLYRVDMTSTLTKAEPAEPTGFDRVFMLSYQWFGVVAILQVVVLGSIISFCTGHKRPGEVEQKYLIPFYDRLFPFLPECILKPLRCGYEYGPEPEEETKSQTDYRMLDGIEPHLGKKIDLEMPINAHAPQKANGNVLEDHIESTGTVTKGNKGLHPDIHVHSENGSVKEENRVARSMDDLTARLRLPVRDIEMTIYRADSQRGSAGFVEVGTVDTLAAIQLRAKSVEFEVLPFK
ncbi:hypothetical protein DPMN_135900 [Dreissena polymorpha]|uniref:Sodium-dependent multivitamin transporter n=1 Tax=Dreissena polymorpha TaxID=45954 RepID=A0A9D4G2T6_DREPO|nr:hypothetical protein DPMN_135900 [Dreissena polymorpha]